MMRQKIESWLKAIPRAWLIASAAILGVVIIGGSVMMYRVYDYVQHDNDFCQSCHLMSGPFDRFNQSAHRGLGCKACHRPNMVQRSKMALTQVLEMPDSISHHAEVPTERCAECHVKGKPEEWKLISKSVGHRLHLESKDPALRGIECLTCHGAGIHQFAAVDKTCGQSGCHEGVKVQLGKMSNLEIHCTSCHDFNKPVADSLKTSGLRAQLSPRGNDCLSCHAMRERIGNAFPANEPHKAVCGSCHNPHDQKTPAEAVTSCTNNGCHTRVDSISPMHRGLASGVAQNCTTCHKAHTWKVDANACSSCHSAAQIDSLGSRRRIKFVDTQKTTTTMSVIDAVLLPLRLSIVMVAQMQQIPAPNPPFQHTPHKAVACINCHDSKDGHGTVKVATVADCASCHHSAKNQARCTTCHTQKELATPIALKTSKTGNFEHKLHTPLACNSCHTDPRAFKKNVPVCTSCHEKHHTANRDCSTCHKDAETIENHNRNAHLSCQSCHKGKLDASVRTQRSVCLACHTDKAKHEAGGDCASCHMIPKSKATP